MGRRKRYTSLHVQLPRPSPKFFTRNLAAAGQEVHRISLLNHAGKFDRESGLLPMVHARQREQVYARISPFPCRSPVIGKPRRLIWETVLATFVAENAGISIRLCSGPVALRGTVVKRYAAELRQFRRIALQGIALGGLNGGAGGIRSGQIAGRTTCISMARPEIVPPFVPPHYLAPSGLPGTCYAMVVERESKRSRSASGRVGLRFAPPQR